MTDIYNGDGQWEGYIDNQGNIIIDGWMTARIDPDGSIHDKNGWYLGSLD